MSGANEVVIQKVPNAAFGDIAQIRAIQCDRDGNAYARTEGGDQPVSIQNVTIFDQVDGNAVNTNIWTVSTSNMTVAQSNGEITLNNGGATTANAYAILKTIKHVPFFSHLPALLDMSIKLTTLPIANLTIEWGFGDPSGTNAIGDGCFFRYKQSDQTLRAITVFNGTETESAALEAFAINEHHDVDITIDNDEVIFSDEQEEMAELTRLVAQPFPVNATRLPVFLRVYNGAQSPAAAGKISLGRMIVKQLIASQNRPWSHTLILQGRSIYQAPATPFDQTAQWANSAAPSAANLSNTTPSYATLGGIFRFDTPAGGNTDYALFGFQVPVGYQLVIGGISISMSVTGADVGASGLLFAWALGLNSSGASLATAESPPTSWAPRRVALGLQSLIKSQGVGDQPQIIERVFDPPLVVDGGRYVHVIVRVPVSDDTASQIMYGTVTFNGYFD